MSQQGMNMGQVKIQNRSVILHCINRASSISRKDIAEQTGLTAAAVTLICNEFIQSGLLVEGESVKKETGAGRRKVLVSINYQAIYFVAISIESDKTVIAITDMQGNVAQIQHIPTQTDISSEEFLAKICDVAKDLIQKCGKEIANKVKFGGISIPGIVNVEKGLSVLAYGIWDHEVAVCKILYKNLGIRFAIDNNVTSFARAEQAFGLGKEQKNVLIIKWGPGVGAATFIENKIYTRIRGKTAEIGHFIVDRDGKQCVCGRRGCLQTLVSADALQGKTEDEIKNAIEMFAVTIANILIVLAPDKIVIYGELAQNKKYFELLQESCKKFLPDYDEKNLHYTILAEKEEFIGPVSVALDTFIFLGN